MSDSGECHGVCHREALQGAGECRVRRDGGDQGRQPDQATFGTGKGGVHAATEGRAVQQGDCKGEGPEVCLG